MELALSLEKLTNEKLLYLHEVASRNNDVQLADFVESEFRTEQVEAIKKISEYVAQLRRVGKGHEPAEVPNNEQNKMSDPTPKESSEIVKKVDVPANPDKITAVVLHYPLEQELCLVGHLDRKLQITTCNCTGWIPWVHKLSFWNGGRTKLKEGLLELVSYRISNATFTPITTISICCLF